MSESHQTPRLAVGVMTGTSIDGIDAALVRIEGAGLAMRCTLVRHVSESLAWLQPRLRAAANQQPMTAGDFATLAWDFGVLHADVIARLLAWETNGPGVPSLICIHGQTVFHQPPISWQLANPAPLAARFNCPVISDLRQADLAQGGQGAPITPLADWILFRDKTSAKSRAIVNLGGFCNVTMLPLERAGASSPPEPSLRGIRGFDVCACNQLLDAIARDTLKQPFDKDGAAASRGHASPPVTESLRAMLERQSRDGRSLGTGDEAAAWIRENRTGIAPDDLAASAVHAIAQTIIATISIHRADELILAGGGARNRALHTALQAAAGRVPVRLSDELGVPIEAREAMCFAVLGALCQDGVAISLPQVTGCSDPAPLGGTCTNPRQHSRRV